MEISTKSKGAWMVVILVSMILLCMPAVVPPAEGAESPDAVKAIMASDLAWYWAGESGETVESLEEIFLGASIGQLLDIESAKSYAEVIDILGSPSEDYVYTPVEPCRIVDTRDTAAGPIAAGGTRDFVVLDDVVAQGGNPAGCPSPRGEPRAVHVNVTALPVGGSGHFRVFPFNTPLPNASLVNYQAGVNIANAAIIKTCFGCGSDISVFSRSTAHVIMDVLGYFHEVEGESVTTALLAPGAVTDAKISGIISASKIQQGSGSGLDADTLDTKHASEFYTKAEVDTLLTAYETRIAALEAKLAKVTADADNIYITGANLHVRSGSGSTQGTVNGTGNVIIGYNELRGGVNNRTGSHNLVVGIRHNYSSYGGIVVGYTNTISGSYSSVSGGSGNIASGLYSSVSGGLGNTAFADYSSVSGGYSNTAFADYSSVSGGVDNTASGGYSSVSGGINNTASGGSSSVSGGRYNTASGDYSFVAGGGGATVGDGNIAFGHYTSILGGFRNRTGDPVLTDQTIGQQSTVSGGNGNIASGLYSSISGGGAGRARALSSSISGGWENEANGNYSSVAAGRQNEASGGSSSVSGGSGNIASGLYSSVSGGDTNTASGSSSSVNGGWHNVASGTYSSVSGGTNNTASGGSSSVSGGSSNTASGDNSSVSGGSSRSATGYDDWAAGGLWEDF